MPDDAVRSSFFSAADGALFAQTRSFGRVRSSGGVALGLLGRFSERKTYLSCPVLTLSFSLGLDHGLAHDCRGLMPEGAESYAKA